MSIGLLIQARRPIDILIMLFLKRRVQGNLDSSFYRVRSRRNTLGDILVANKRLGGLKHGLLFLCDEKGAVTIFWKDRRKGEDLRSRMLKDVKLVSE